MFSPRPKASVLAALLAAVVLIAGCGKNPGANAPSLVLVTFGCVTDDAFKDPAITPSFAHLASQPGMECHSALPFPAGRERLLAAVPILRRAGYNTAAFLADPDLLPAAAAFATSAVPGRARVPIRLAPAPFETTPHEFMRHGDTVVGAALAWIATQAGIPSPQRRQPGAPPAPVPSPTQLRTPLFLWIHLADPAFHDSPEHIRVSGPSSATIHDAEVAFLDMQLGRVIGFLADHGLTNQVRLAAVCLEGAPTDAADAASGAWRLRPLPGLYPTDTAPLLPLPSAVPPPDDLADETPNPAAGLTYRLLHPRTADTNLVADCTAWRDAHSDDPEAWGWLGVAQARAGNLSDAIASHARALALAPSSPFRMANLGLAHLAAGEIAQGIDQIENAYLAAPTEPRYRDTLAAILLRTGLGLAAQDSDNEALQCLSRVVYLQPRNPQAYVAMGRLQAKMNLTALARASFEKALSLHPRFKPALDGLRALDTPSGE